MSRPVVLPVTHRDWGAHIMWSGPLYTWGTNDHGEYCLDPTHKNRAAESHCG